MSTFVVTSHLFMMQNRAPSSVSKSPSSFTVKYLTNSCGLPLQSAIATSQQLDQKLNETNTHRSDSVLNLFKSYGLDATHVARIISKRPRVLYDFDSDKYLRPKMEYLVEIGFSGTVLGDMIVICPNILLIGLNSQIKPNFESLRDSLGSLERARAAVMASPWLLSNGRWRPNIDLLLREGVAADTIIKLIPRRSIALSQNVDEIARAVNMVKDLGIDPAEAKFLKAVLVVASYPLWVKKARVFTSFGFSEDEMLSILRVHPLCFDYSEKKLGSSFEFFVNTMKLKVNTISSYPFILGYSIDKRVHPRYDVLKLLLSKKLLEERDAKLVTALVKTEKLFLEDYVYKHLDQIPNLLDVYCSGTSQE